MNKFWLNFYTPFFSQLEREFPLFTQQLAKNTEHAFYEKPHGKINDWQSAIEEIQEVVATGTILNHDCISVTFSKKLSSANALEKNIETFKPWRKGPFQVDNVFIDTEWRSDWKWNRIKDKIIPLKGKRVLDVGCGSGYHCFRMIGDGAQQVIGLEPMISYVAQFNWLNQLLKQPHVTVLPFTLEQWGHDEAYFFDTVFSMGVLYHRRAPIDHLYELKKCLNPGGQLVLETMIIEGDDDSVLVPTDRYAQMRNVWFIPTVKHLKNWLNRAGFKDINVIDINRTSIEEQRSTKWMAFDSLVDFLDKDDLTKTVEGYSSPIRVTITAIKK